MAELVADSRDTSWMVKMAQYVPPPSAEALTSLLPYFKKRRSVNLRGIWLSSKSMATVTLSSASSNGSGPSIALILQGHVHEEHLLSTVAFTWPRFRNKNAESFSFGRVILASYKITSSNEKRKFAMQFETVLQAEWFFRTVKQLIDFHNGASRGIDDVCPQQVPPGSPVYILDSCCLGDEAALNGSVSSVITSLEASRSTSSTFPLTELSVNTGNLLANNNPTVALPPRFPWLNLQQQQIQLKNTLCGQQEGASSKPIIAALQSEQLLKEKLKACFLDPEFQDFVNRVERIWQSMEEEFVSEIQS